MHLEHYISDLLYRYECVTVPNFGSFLAQRISATIDEATHTFYPPRKNVSFNEQIQNNDGLLAHYIADLEKIPFEAANKFLSQQVKMVKSDLTQGKAVSFQQIGTFVFNSEGRIVFKPSRQLNYLTDAFGLPEFSLPHQAVGIQKNQDISAKKHLPTTTVRRQLYPLLKYTAIALIVMTFCGIAASKAYITQVEKHNQLAQQKASQQLDATVQRATFRLGLLPSVTLQVTKQVVHYHIVAGAFRVKAHSDKLVKKLKSEGFNARQIGVNKYGLHEVAYASYKNRSLAVKALRNIRKRYNRNAWLLVKTLVEE